MSAVYPSAVDAALSGTLDVTSDTLKIQAVSATYVYDAAHEHLDDLSGTVSTPATLTNVAVSGGIVTCDAVVLEAVTGDDITGFVVYQDTGDAATSLLLALITVRIDKVPISIEPTGGNLSLSFADGLFTM